MVYAIIIGLALATLVAALAKAEANHQQRQQDAERMIRAAIKPPRR